MSGHYMSLRFSNDVKAVESEETVDCGTVYVLRSTKASDRSASSKYFLTSSSTSPHVSKLVLECFKETYSDDIQRRNPYCKGKQYCNLALNIDLS